MSARVDLVLFPLGVAERFAARLARELSAPVGRLETRRFPDGESYVRLADDVAGRRVAVVAHLDGPDEKLAPLLFAAHAARDLGAASVGLVAPYLPYMRQDTRFQPGEAVTSRAFGHLLSGWFDWLVTVDPHLHRHVSLDEVYRIPTRAVSAGPRMAAWIRQNVAKPVIVGPDVESRQWVRVTAEGAGAPAIVLEKRRRGDREVEISVPDLDRWREHTPVLVDDIISTARTMSETVRALVAAGLAPPVCIGVHAVFSGDAAMQLRRAGAGAVATCNTLPHDSNRIDVSPLVAEAIRDLAAVGPTA